MGPDPARAALCAANAAKLALTGKPIVTVTTPAPAVRDTSQGRCVVNVKSAMMALAEASAALTAAPQKCKTDGSTMVCADMALRVTSHLARLGKFLMKATKDCGKQKVANIPCAGGVSSLIEALSTVGAAGMEIEKKCESAAHRLFLDGPTNIEVPNTLLPPFSMVLVAFVPIISVASFLGGRRLQKQQSERAYARTGDEEMVSFE